MSFIDAKMFNFFFLEHLTGYKIIEVKKEVLIEKCLNLLSKIEGVFLNMD